MNNKKMFSGNRFATMGIVNSISIDVQNKLWEMIRELENEGMDIDYLQVFKLQIDDENRNVQIIEHTQEIPEYKNTLRIEVKNSIDEKIFIISSSDANGMECSTILLAREY